MNYEQTENHRQYAFRKQKIYELEGQCSVLQKYYDRITELLDTPASGGYTTVTKDDYRRFIKSSPNAFDRDDFRSGGSHKHNSGGGIGPINHPCQLLVVSFFDCTCGLGVFYFYAISRRHHAFWQNLSRGKRGGVYHPLLHQRMVFTGFAGSLPPSVAGFAIRH